jgi:transposase
MARHRTYPIAFKRQVAQEFLSGEVSLHGLAKRHDVCRNLIRVWVEKYERGEFDDEVEAANLLEQYEARIAALERLVGRLALENDLLKNVWPAPSASGFRSALGSRPQRIRPRGMPPAQMEIRAAWSS